MLHDIVTPLDNWTLSADEYLARVYAMRRANLETLIKFYGSVGALARAAEYSADVLRHLRHRTFTEKTARHIEMCLGLEYGWLDIPYNKILLRDIDAD